MDSTFLPTDKNPKWYGDVHSIAEGDTGRVAQLVQRYIIIKIIMAICEVGHKLPTTELVRFGNSAMLRTSHT